MSTRDDTKSDAPTLDDLVPSEGTPARLRFRNLADEEAAGFVESELEVLLDEWDPALVEQLSELIRGQPERLARVRRLLSGESDEGWPKVSEAQRMPSGEPSRVGPRDASTMEEMAAEQAARHRMGGEGAPDRLDMSEPFSPVQVQRSRRKPNTGEQDDARAPASAAEGVGHPTSDSSHRTPLGEDEQASWQGASPVEGLGNPSTTASQRIGLGEEEVPSWKGASPVEGLGNPSTTAAQRVAIGEEEVHTWKGASPVESVGNPSQRAEQRLATGEEETPSWRGPSPVESAGNPSERAEQRVALGEEEVPTWKGASPVESVGNPSQRARDRVVLGEEEGPSRKGASPVESVGRPSQRAQERLALGEDEVPTWRGGSPVESAGSPSELSADRLSMGPEARTRSSSAQARVQGLLETLLRRAILAGQDPEELLRGLEAAGFPSAQARDRVGSAGEEAERESTQRRGAAPFESSNAADRMPVVPRATPTAGGLSNALGGDIAAATDAALRIKRAEPRPSGVSRHNGLDGVFAVPIIEGAAQRYRREEVPTPEPDLRRGIDPIPPTRIRLVGELSKAQRAATEGDPRWTRPKVTEVLDFVHHRFELLEVERRTFTSWSDPGATPEAVELPRFAAGSVPFGNGLLAFVLESRYAHDLMPDEQLRLLGRVWKTFSHKQVRQASASAFTLVQPVLEQVWKELCGAKGVKVDTGTVSALHLGPKRSTKGQIRGAANASHLRLWFHHNKAPDLLSELGKGADDGMKEVSEIFGRMMQWSRESLWTNVRRRFIGALPTEPEETGRVLYLLERIHRAGVVDPKARPEHLAALHAHLVARTPEEDAPDTPFRHAVVYTLAMWERIASESAEAVRKPQAWRAEAMPWILDEQEAPPDEHLGWVSLIAGSSRLGGRPWTYLRDLLDAATADEPLKPEQWTPAAWWKRQRH